MQTNNDAKDLLVAALTERIKELEHTKALPITTSSNSFSDILKKNSTFMQSVRTEIFTEKLEQNKVDYCITISGIPEKGSTPEEIKQQDTSQIDSVLV